jgi:hypothetical protein
MCIFKALGKFPEKQHHGLKKVEFQHFYEVIGYKWEQVSSLILYHKGEGHLHLRSGKSLLILIQVIIAANCILRITIPHEYKNPSITGTYPS